MGTRRATAGILPGVSGRLWLTGLAAVGLLALFTSCGSTSGTGGGGLGATAQSGQVALPAGVSAAGLKVVNSNNAVSVKTDGTFRVPVYTVGHQLTVVTTSSDVPLLMGWLDSGAQTVNSHTTAEVALYFALGGFGLPLDAQQQLATLLRTAPEVDPVAAAIDAALAADPTALSKDCPAVRTAIDTAVAALHSQFTPEPDTTRRAVAVSPLDAGRALLVNPSEGHSGVDVLTDKGLNALYFGNHYRRRAFAYLRHVSDFDSEGHEQAVSPATTLTTVTIEPTAGLKSLTGTLVDMVYATWGDKKYAYEDVYSDPPVVLPVTSGMSKSRYRVTVVGPGEMDGSLSQLDAEQLAKQQSVTQVFLVKDLFLPLVTNVLVSVSKDTINQAAGWAAGADGVVKDLINALTTQAPGIWDKTARGDMKGALGDAWNAFVGSTTFRNLCCQKVMDLIGKHDYWAADSAAANAKALLNAMKAVDGLLTGFDTFAIGYSIGQSNMADVWTVDVTEPKVRLAPNNTQLKLGQTVDLTASVIDAGEGQVFEYRWTNTHGFGDIFWGDHLEPAGFTSSSNKVTYAATKTTQGSDTVSVDVYLVKGADRTQVGSAHVTVQCLGQKVVIAPTEQTLTFADQKTFTATLDPPAGTGTTLAYRWTTPGAHGTIQGGGTTYTGGATCQYTAGDTVGADTLTAEILMVSSINGAQISYGTATASITVREPCLDTVPTHIGWSGCSTADISAHSVAPGGTLTVSPSWTGGGVCGGSIMVYCSHAVSATGAGANTFTTTASPYFYFYGDIDFDADAGGAVFMDQTTRGSVTFHIDPNITSDICVKKYGNVYKGPLVDVCVSGSWSSPEMFEIRLPGSRRE